MRLKAKDTSTSRVLPLCVPGGRRLGLMSRNGGAQPPRWELKLEEEPGSGGQGEAPTGKTAPEESGRGLRRFAPLAS